MVKGLIHERGFIMDAMEDRALEYLSLLYEMGWGPLVSPNACIYVWGETFWIGAAAITEKDKRGRITSINSRTVIKSTHFTVETRRWLNLVAKWIHPSSNVSDAIYHCALMGVYHSLLFIIALWERAGVSREPRDNMIDCDVPFDPLRGEGCTRRSKKKRKVDSNREDSNDQGVAQMLYKAPLSPWTRSIWGFGRPWRRRRGRGARGRAVGLDVEGDESLLRTLTPRLRFLKVTIEDAQQFSFLIGLDSKVSGGLATCSDGATS
ncbi:hypothetical protein HAX54_031528 [Datura stramonium]|uniref:Uncharacterized protein n=1 Tax=Datura stramonium TaxID=4076 RepID=A0ABS8RJ28_DATST|nr:hypothetical protein [Datura stramonium]